MSEQNREKEERLFRALSGVEEELLHRSEQNEGVEKRKANGKIRRFPLYYVSRIALLQGICRRHKKMTAWMRSREASPL